MRFFSPKADDNFETVKHATEEMQSFHRHLSVLYTKQAEKLVSTRLTLPKNIKEAYGVPFDKKEILRYQKDIFSVLDCQRKIGLTLNDSMLMSPTKSVTAIIGIGE